VGLFPRTGAGGEGAEEGGGGGLRELLALSRLIAGLWWQLLISVGFIVFLVAPNRSGLILFVWMGSIVTALIVGLYLYAKLFEEKTDQS
jgi:hypothetical protein